MFHFSDKIDWSHFFRFDKRWIENMNWARIFPAAKTVLPVICCYCNERGESFPGEAVIAALSGMTAKSVRRGIHDLEGFPGYNWEHYLTRRGRQGKRFSIDFPEIGEKGHSFFFYRGIIDSGIWSELKPAARSLYPVMRYFSRYDADEDEDLEEVSDFDEHYANRKWELCNAEVGQLAKYAGINRHTVAEAMKSLQANFLLEPYVGGNGEKTSKVYLIPKKYWKASYLNQKLKIQAGA